MEESFEVDKIVLLERNREKICEQSGVVDAAETSCWDRNLRRSAEQDSVEAVKSIPQERISERGAQSEAIKVTGTSGQDRSWQRTVEQIR